MATNHAAVGHPAPSTLTVEPDTCGVETGRSALSWAATVAAAATSLGERKWQVSPAGVAPVSASARAVAWASCCA